MAFESHAVLDITRVVRQYLLFKRERSELKLVAKSNLTKPNLTSRVTNHAGANLLQNPKLRKLGYVGLRFKMKLASLTLLESENYFGQFKLL